MKKLMIALIAGSISAATAGAFAASGSPADSDKAGRMGPGTAAGQMGAADPSPGKAGAGGSGSMRGGSSGMGASSSSGMGGSSATSGSGGSGSEGTGRRRARRASKG